MRHLRALADAGVLDLDERAGLRARLEHGAGAEVAERPDEASSPTAESTTTACGPTSARAAIRDAPRITVNGWITASGSMTTSASIHVLAGSTIVTPASMCASLTRSRSAQPPPPARLACSRPRSPPDRLPCAPRHVAFLDEERDRVRQVELALRVVRRQPVEHRPQPICPEHVDGRVHLADRALLVGRVPVLDDRLEAARRSRSTRPYCLGSSGSNERTVAAAPSRRCVSTRSRRRSDVRSGVSPERTSTSSARLRAPRAHCEPRLRSARLLLNRDRHTVESGAVAGAPRRRSDRRRARARLEHPIHHPASEDRVQVLRHIRAHARAEAGRHHDRAERPLSPFDDTEAGAPGFEPGITGPKPVALPLGHAPERASSCHSREIGSPRPDA